jgi:pSer/pThr/pTyr-binding forkhead associated (FHA) protein
MSRFELVVIGGNDMGRRVPLPRESVTLGRGVAPGVAHGRLTFNDPTISREQALLHWDPLLQTFVLHHSENASNLTRVNERPVQTHVLRPGDVIRTGQLALRMVVTGEREALEDVDPDRMDPTAQWAVNAQWHLAFTSDPERGRTISIASLMDGRVITVGGEGPRKNDVALWDPKAANEAARLEWVRGGFWLRVENAEEVRVNEQRVEDHAKLLDGDVVRLGATAFVLRRGPPDGDEPWEAMRWIEVMRGVDTDAGLRVALGDEPVSVGRSPRCSLALRDNAVSRHHVSIAAREGEYVLAHKSASNPTLVNGVEVDRERVLAHGDEIQLSAHTVLRFVVKGMELFG